MSQVSLAYAEGLFELAKENKTVEAFKEEMDAILEIYQANKDIRSFFASVKISNTDKKDLIEKAFKDKVSKHVLNFMKLLVDKGRMDQFEEIGKDFHKLTNKELGIREGIVETARPLDKETIEKLENVLSDKEKVVLKPRINKALLSGFKVIFEDEIIDYTLKEKLEGLKNALLERK